MNNLFYISSSGEDTAKLKHLLKLENEVLSNFREYNRANDCAGAVRGTRPDTDWPTGKQNYVHFLKLASFLFAKLQRAEHRPPGSAMAAVLIFN